MPIILIVDDDLKLLKMMRRTLSYEGYEVMTALNGHEALFHVEEKAPDLVIFDWMMPVLNGLDVMTGLRVVSQ